MESFNRYVSIGVKPQNIEGYYAAQGLIVNCLPLPQGVNETTLKSAFCQFIYSFPGILTSYPHAAQGQMFLARFSPELTAQLLKKNLENLKDSDEAERILPPEEPALPVRMFLIADQLQLHFSHDIFNGLKATRFRHLFLAILSKALDDKQAVYLRSEISAKVRNPNSFGRLKHLGRFAYQFMKMTALRVLPTRQIVTSHPYIEHGKLKFRSFLFRLSSSSIQADATAARVSSHDYFVRKLAATFFALEPYNRLTLFITLDLHKYASGVNWETPGNFTIVAPVSLTRWTHRRFRLNHKLFHSIVLVYFQVMDFMKGKSQNASPKSAETELWDIRRPLAPVANFGDLGCFLSFIEISENPANFSYYLHNCGSMPIITIGIAGDRVEIGLSYNSTRFGPEEAFLKNLIVKTLESLGSDLQVQEQNWPKYT